MPKGNRRPNNRGQIELAPGVMRFSRARMFHKKGLFKTKPFKGVKKAKKAEAEHIVKKVNGAQNGGERKVLKVKPPRRLGEFRTSVKRAAHKRKTMPNHRLRKSITPGTVLVLLGGRHKGKRVVFLKHLPKSGLLLVTGPMKLNNVPLRRISQAYVIATKTKLDVSKVKVPEHVTDDYFKRAPKPKRVHGKDGEDIFAETKKVYVVTQQRKDDQKLVDGSLMAAIRAHADKKMLFGYLGSKWSIRKGDAPHKMIF